MPSLWSAGIVFTILSPLAKAISTDDSKPYLNTSWEYLLYFNLVVWGIIGIIYGFERFILKREVKI